MKMVPRIPRKISYVAHGRSALWAIRQKTGYLEHIDSDFESEKCVTKLRLKARP